MNVLVLEDGASNYQFIVLAEVDLSPSIFIDVTTYLFSNNSIFPFFVGPNFRIKVSL